MLIQFHESYTLAKSSVKLFHSTRFNLISRFFFPLTMPNDQKQEFIRLGNVSRKNLHISRNFSYVSDSEIMLKKGCV